jgi:small GTP-binding protein
MAANRLTDTSINNLLLSYPRHDEDHSDYLFKIILIGDVGVGKSSALQRFRYGTFSERHANTIGVDFTFKTLKMSDGKVVQLQIWDTAGQERYRTITQSYYRNAHGVLLAYDITNERSYHSLQRWMEDLKKFCGNVIIIVIGTKLDIVQSNTNTREVPEESGQSIVDAYSNVMGFYETSSRDGLNVDEAFMGLITALRTKVDRSISRNCECEISQVITTPNSLPLKQQKRKCC